MPSADLPQDLSAGDWVRLHHGTDETSANDIHNNGLSRANAIQCGGTGEFWATTDLADAEVFAQANPVGGIPPRYSFDFPRAVLQTLLTSNPPHVYLHGANWYEFLPIAYPILNQHMANREVVAPVP